MQIVLLQIQIPHIHPHLHPRLRHIAGAPAVNVRPLKSRTGSAGAYATGAAIITGWDIIFAPKAFTTLTGDGTIITIIPGGTTGTIITGAGMSIVTIIMTIDILQAAAEAVLEFLNLKRKRRSKEGSLLRVPPRGH